VFVLVYWHKSSKPLGISWVVVLGGSFLYWGSDLWWALISLPDQLVFRETSHVITGLELWANLTPGESRVTGDWLQSHGLVVNYQLKLWTPRLRGISWMVSTCVSEGDMPWLHKERVWELWTPSEALPSVYPLQWNWNRSRALSLRSINHFMNYWAEGNMRIPKFIAN
jgi:hypothetical protein